MKKHSLFVVPLLAIMMALVAGSASAATVIILNNDGDDSLASRKDGPPVVDQFLQLRTAPLVGSQVDTIFYCSIRCFGSVLHRTDVAENLTTHLKGSFPNSLMSGLLSQGTDPSRSCSSSATPRKSRSSARCA